MEFNEDGHDSIFVVTPTSRVSIAAENSSWVFLIQNKKYGHKNYSEYSKTE
jgi:hypothetical protein